MPNNLPSRAMQAQPRRRYPRAPEQVAIAILVASAVCALWVSWRKWPDPLIDAGHQLYTAWRLSEGALLYRDVGCLYGPLSSYFNAFLFRIFGPGMMVLVWANLVAYTLIAALAYAVFRSIYGAKAAFAALLLFVWVFSFNQLVPVGNYNYALPYAHESTHGMLISLALLLAADRWILHAGRLSAASMGILCGLTLVLKPEFILVGLLVAGSAAVVRVLRKTPPSLAEVAAFGLAALVPMATFTLAFWRHLTLPEAFRAANQAWWAVLVGHVRAQVWGGFLGSEAPWSNLATMLLGTALLAMGFCVMWIGTHKLARGAKLAGLLIPLPVVAALAWVDWMQAAWGIPLALLAVLGRRAARLWRDPHAQSPLGLMLALTALALLVRMFLHPRFYHFGFYQAALATMVVVAELSCGLQAGAERQPVSGLAALASGGLALVAACLAVFLRSHEYYSLRSFPVGTGRDAFLAFSPKQDASGLLVDEVVHELSDLPAQDQTLVVPEGLMINYLARRQSPLPEWIFIDLTLGGSAEASLLERLSARLPEHVVLISRDLREHGIVRFGEPGQPGEQLMDLFRRDYRLRAQWGGDPLDPADRGALILDRAR
jgi:hypothetical protein